MGEAPKSSLADWLYPAGLIAVAALVLVEAGKLAPAPFDPLGPKTFPIWTAWALIVLGVTMIARQLLGFGAGQARQSMVLGLGETGASARRPLVAIALFVLALGYAAALSFRAAGFLAATAAFVFAAMLLLGRRDRRSIAVAAVAAIVFATANDQLFRRLFALDLP